MYHANGTLLPDSFWDAAIGPSNPGYHGRAVQRAMLEEAGREFEAEAQQRDDAMWCREVLQAALADGIPSGDLRGALHEACDRLGLRDVRQRGIAVMYGLEHLQNAS